MKNLKGDLIWAAIFILSIAAFLIPVSREAILGFSGIHPYIAGFLKFAVLATLGDLIGIRILKNAWDVPKHLPLKALVWGILGMMITLAFTIFTGGTAAAQAIGKLPFEGSALAAAFFGSLTMNVTFGPMMYIFHKSGDYFFDCLTSGKMKEFTGKAFAATVDWTNMVSFFWLKTCLLVWVPLHTIVFLLPEEYRVVASAFLSILLGVLVALSKKSSAKKEELAL